MHFLKRKQLYCKTRRTGLLVESLLLCWQLSGLLLVLPFTRGSNVGSSSTGAAGYVYIGLTTISRYNERSCLAQRRPLRYLCVPFPTYVFRSKPRPLVGKACPLRGPCLHWAHRDVLNALTVVAAARGKTKGNPPEESNTRRITWRSRRMK